MSGHGFRHIALIPCAVGLGALAGAAAPAAAQSPDFTAILNVRPNPSPYIADWQSDPSIVTLVLSYTGSADVSFYLIGRILRGAEPVLGGTSSAFEFPRPSQLLLTTRDGIWDPNSVTYQSTLKSQLERTGRIPDGDYEFCVEVHAGLPESGGGPLLASACAPFTIVAPNPPSLISPSDGDTVPNGFLSLAWTPVMAGFNVSVAYHVRIAEILPGQSPLEAINNVPQFEGDFTTTSLLYPPTALALRDSARYVWQVQAVDGAGQPLGEREGKSEAWTFAYLSRGPIALGADSTPPDTTKESAVGSFKWGNVQVKVLALSDSSRSNYTGRGRVAIIPGILEPSFRFKSVHLDSSGTAVAYAPTHVVSLPTGANVADYVMKGLPVPFYLNVKALELVADSSTGERYAGLTGTGVVFLSLGAVDSVIAADTAPTPKWKCSGDTTLVLSDTTITQTLCEPADDAAPSPSMTDRLKAAAGIANALAGHGLFFRYDDLRLDPKGPAGTVTLARDFTSGIFGWSGAKLTLKADSTALTMQGGSATLALEGDLKLPGSSGLVRDKPDTTFKKDGTDTTKKIVTGIDSTVTLQFTKAQLGTDGEVYLAAKGLPPSHIGSTGLHIQTGNAWIDFSDKLSPSGRAAGWQGVAFDSARIDLPDHWQKQNAGDATASIVGYGLAVDGQGFSGNIFGSQLQRLGPVAFGGFSGKLDSLHFRFTTGTLDTGYVAGSLTVPFLTGAVAYWVDFTPAGVDRAYAQIGTQTPIDMPALHAKAVIQRGSFTYERPLGTFTMDAKLTIDQDGVSLKDAQVYGLSISSDGTIKLGQGWLAFDGGNQADFKHFPVALDSIGFGSGSNGNETWLGLAGRFSLNGNLPAAAGAFRVFASRQAPGDPWGFEKLAVDKLALSFTNAAVSFRGAMDYMQDDSVYGTGFKAALKLSVQNEFMVDGNFIVGATNATTASSSFRYWYVDASLLLPPPGIQLGPLPLSIYGFGGGAYSRMTARLDSVSLKRTYVPDSTNAFGLKAHLTIGTSANAGYIWNADGELAAEVGTSGGLSSLTFRADNWMLTDVSRREQKIWGTVQVSLPVSQPVFQANMNLNVRLKPALTGSGWAEMRFAPTDWYLHVGTEQRRDSLTLLPGTPYSMPTTSYFLMDGTGVDAGFATHLTQEKKLGDFYGKIDAGFDATARLRYRPFMASGDGDLWGDIIAKYKSYTLLEGTARATMAFTLPDPTRIWGKVTLGYNLLGGLYKGTYSMRYSWGSAGSESSDTSFTLVAATYPVDGDTAAPVSGVSFYLGMSEGGQYGMDNGVYRLHLVGTPTIDTACVPGPRTQCSGAKPVLGGTANDTVWQSIGPIERQFTDARQTLTLKAPGYVTLTSGTRYRASAMFVLEKWVSDTTWTDVQTKTAIVTFTTDGQTPALGQLVSGTDPAGAASPLYYGGPNKGTVRVQFTNVTPAITSGAVVPILIASGTDTVAGSWRTQLFATGALAQGPSVSGDPTRYAFTPTAGALAPSTPYRLALVRADTTHQEEYAVSFRTSQYPSLADHIAASTATVTPTRGPGPVSGTGNYLLGVAVKLAGPEPISWQDIDSIEVTGVSSAWQVIPSTRCEWLGGGSPPPIIGIGVGTATLCGQPTVYDNLLKVTFSATDDASLPSATTPSLTIRMKHRREGWQTSTFTVPQPIVTPTPRVLVPPPPTVDVTKATKVTTVGKF